MTMAQITVVVLTVLLNAMDGFDILSIAFASPGIMSEWHITRAQLGVVLSAELIGMGIGSVFLGGVADKLGRRPTLMGCLVVMAMGMIGATTATNPTILSIWRIFTGLGIGGMLSATNAVVGEFSSTKRRSLCISLMVIGYPLGGGIGGLYASSLIHAYGWRSVFYFGATATAILLPLVFFCVPESVQWLTRTQPAKALARVNTSLRRLGHQTVSTLPEIQPGDRKKSIADIFSPSLVRVTVILTACYFLHILTFYFLLKWTPQIIADMKFAGASAGRVLAFANLGGAAGGIVFGLLTSRIGLKPLTIGILLLNAVAVVSFGQSAVVLSTLTTLAILVGFFGNAAVSGLYSIVAYSFPTHVRATGTGFVIGVGRAGAALSPILAGYLFNGGIPLPSVAMIMATGSLLAAFVLLLLKVTSLLQPAVKEKSATMRMSQAEGRASS